MSAKFPKVGEQDIFFSLKSISSQLKRHSSECLVCFCCCFLEKYLFAANLPYNHGNCFPSFMRFFSDWNNLV